MSVLRQQTRAEDPTQIRLTSDDSAKGGVPTTSPIVRYVRSLNTPRLILWCYAIWYAVMLVRYFDPNPRLWLTSLGLSAIIGFALWMSTTAGIPAGTRVDRWGIFRLFLMPFCVSSFAALVKGRDFFLIISPRAGENFLALALCAVMLTSVKMIQRRAC